MEIQDTIQKRTTLVGPCEREEEPEHSFGIRLSHVAREGGMSLRNMKVWPAAGDIIPTRYSQYILIYYTYQLSLIIQISITWL